MATTISSSINVKDLEFFIDLSFPLTGREVAVFFDLSKNKYHTAIRKKRGLVRMNLNYSPPAGGIQHASGGKGRGLE